MGQRDDDDDDQRTKRDELLERTRVHLIERVRFRLDWNIADLEDVRDSALAADKQELATQCTTLIGLMTAAQDIAPHPQ